MDSTGHSLSWPLALAGASAIYHRHGAIYAHFNHFFTCAHFYHFSLVHISIIFPLMHISIIYNLCTFLSFIILLILYLESLWGDSRRRRSKQKGDFEFQMLSFQLLCVMKKCAPSFLKQDHLRRMQHWTTTIIQVYRSI